ncbi:MAG TPA: hypothetical protein VN939_19950 [Chthoniobacterales bacterium]|nr:hypothetical protein [Chthoniobacterales bacterium]
MQTVGLRGSACAWVGGIRPRADFFSGLVKVTSIFLAIGVSASTSLQASDIHQSYAGTPMAGGRVLTSRGGMAGFYYNGYGSGEVRSYRGPMVIAPRWRQNQAGLAKDSSNNVGNDRTQDARLNGANLAAASQSLSSPQGTGQKSINLPAGMKPQVISPAERSQAAANINQKFQQAENKVASQPGVRPDRRNRLEQSRVYFLGLLDYGCPLSLLDTWCDDLLDDQVDDGMPIDLIDSYWGEPVSTQDYVEYYNPYQVCTYQTPDGNYRQVTFQNGVVSQAM